MKEHEATLSITANIAPGWHLYSQFLKEGGPIPTRFNYERNDDYRLIGDTAEKGKRVVFYDDIYEMEITWYADSVSFSQRISLNHQVTTIKGKVEYMVCNSQMCIPDERQFTVDVKPY